MLQLRCLEEADLPAVLRIQEACYHAIAPESRASLHAKVLASPATCLVAQTAAGVVGYLIAAPIRFPDLPALDAATFRLADDADTLYIHDLAVAQAGRGTGAGRALVRGAVEAAKGRGLQRACLVAIQGSLPYWEQFGFEAVAAPSGAVAAKLDSYGPSARLMRSSF